MTRKLLVFCFVLLIIASCKNEEETPNGMKYKVLRRGDGVKPKTGQFLVFHYELKDNKDSVWSNTWTEGIPAFQPISDSSNIPQEDGMRQMLRSLSVGDSVITTMKIAAFFKDLVRAPAPPYVDTTGTVSYTIVPQSISSPEEYFSDREPLIQKRDSTYITRFLEKNSLTAERDSSGLRYIIHNRAGGPKPKASDCVEVKYMGRILRNGQVFDAAERAAFPLTNIIPAWQIGIPLLGKGDSATFFVPSGLGYAREGYPGVIPPDAILVFDVTLLDVKTEFDPTTRTCK
jgi:FKBP-type peptidyl-prolyl cis-trans isomerase FkpA